MQRYFTFLLLCVSGASLHAQSTRLPAGKKFKVVAESKTDMKMAVMGQDVQMENSGTNFLDYELSGVTNTGYTLNGTLTRVKMATMVMGQSQAFDTDDETLRNNPQFGEVAKMLNHSNEIIVNNNVATIKGDLGNTLSQAGLSGMANDQSKFILTGDISNWKEGNKWADSVVSDQNSSLNQYTILKSDNKVLDIQVKTLAKINTTITQGGMAIKENIQGMVTSLRHYDRATAMMTAEESEMEFSGTMEVMGQTSPVNMKGKVTTTVN